MCSAELDSRSLSCEICPTRTSEVVVPWLKDSLIRKESEVVSIPVVGVIRPLIREVVKIGDSPVSPSGNISRIRGCPDNESLHRDEPVAVIVRRISLSKVFVMHFILIFCWLAASRSVHPSGPHIS